MSSSRHVPYLSFHKSIIREICRPQKDDLLILAKGLGMRRIVCALLKTYDRKEDLILVVNATPADEAGIGDELGIMGVRSPGFRVLTHELSVDKREEMYRRGGLFSVTSKILVHDFLRKTVPVKLITGLVVLHAEKVSHGSQEEFAIRLYRRENTSGFCKAFSDEPEMFAHGISPLKDMLINLNMTSVMIWPRYNEGVKVALATRQAEVIEMYQSMTDLMRQCQDAITECMEAMLVELKRDHTLNLDLEDLNVRNAQFKSFDTMVRMRLKPVWHKVGAKTRIHVAALTELRNLQTWLLEYDSATFASYINTLHRQFFLAQKIARGPGKHLHDWFNAKAAALLVEASQARVSRRKTVMDNSPEPEHTNDDAGDDPANGGVDIEEDRREFEDDEEALRDVSMEGDEDHDDEVMEVFATQTQTVRDVPRPEETSEPRGDSDEEDEGLQEVQETAPPPVFRPVTFDMETYLTKSVEKRIRKGHEAVLEEQPKWSLLARILKEIEDTIARVSESHADAPGTNIVLVMCSSDRTCLQLRQFLTTMQKTDPPFGPRLGKKMMESLFLSNWQHEQNGAHRMRGPGGDELKQKDEMALAKRAQEQAKQHGNYWKNRGKQPSFKRRRLRGGATMPGRQSTAQMEMEQREALMTAQSAFGGGPDGSSNGQSSGSASTSINGNGNGEATIMGDSQVGPSDPNSSTTPLAANGSSSTAPARNGADSPPLPADPGTSLMMSQGVIEDDMDQARHKQQLLDMGLYEDFETDYGLLPADDAVIIRPSGGEDDDILLQELRPRFVVLYEPNLPFIRRLEVYKNCNPGLALRVYQMVYTNSFEEDRFLSTLSREAEAFKKLIDDRSSMVIPIYNNNPRAPMRDQVSRSKTTYSSRNAGGGEGAEEARILVDIREMGAILPSLIDDAGIRVVPLTLTVGDYILSPKMCVERKALPDLEASLANGRLYSQCEAMTAHYEICILLIEFEEDKFGLRTKEDAKREQVGRPKEEEDWRDTFYLQSKIALLALTFPRLRIIWSSSPHESVKILSDLKLNFDEPDEVSAMMKGQTDVPTLRDSIENPGAVEMLRAMPGISGHNLRLVMGKVEGIQEMVGLKQKQLKEMIGEKNGAKVWRFLHLDSRLERGYEPEDEMARELGTSRK